MRYKFDNLSPLDFEHLCKDILEKELKVSLEIFSPGRDGGIDLKHASINKQENLIVQCKHLEESEFSSLKNMMAKEEAKLDKINPTTYILITSMKITDARKQELLLVNKYIKETSNVLGREEICSLIGSYPDVEKKHIKLWLSSSAILEKVLSNVINRATINKSTFEIEDALERLKYYIHNNSFIDAVKMLDKNNLVIISGEPGVGKTTLAKMLFLYYIDKGFEFINVTSNINEALQMIDISNTKQVFYFDDFLGETNLSDKGEVDGARSILQVINSIRHQGRKFIFTTRENILNQAFMVNENLEREENHIRSVFKYTLKLSDYTNLDKAHIFYSHLYYYKLSEKYIRELVQDKRYKKIIEHKNYNPRLIEYITKDIDSKMLDNQSYFDFALGSLNNPKEIWKTCFLSKTTKEGQSLIISLWSFNNIKDIKNLKAPFTELHKQRSLSSNFVTKEMDFKNAIKETEGVFIKYEKSWLSFSNPSIVDFLDKFLLENGDFIKDLIKVADKHTQLCKIYDKIPDDVNVRDLEVMVEKCVVSYEADAFFVYGEYQYRLLSEALVSINQRFTSELIHNLTLKMLMLYPRIYADDADYIFNIYNKIKDCNKYTAKFINDFINMIYEAIMSQTSTHKNIKRFVIARKIETIFSKEGKSTFELSTYVETNLLDDIRDSLSELSEASEVLDEMIEQIDLGDDFQGLDWKMLLEAKENIENRIGNLGVKEEDDYDRDWGDYVASSKQKYEGIIECLLPD